MPRLALAFLVIVVAVRAEARPSAAAAKPTAAVRATSAMDHARSYARDVYGRDFNAAFVSEARGTQRVKLTARNWFHRLGNRGHYTVTIDQRNPGDVKIKAVPEKGMASRTWNHHFVRVMRAQESLKKTLSTAGAAVLATIFGMPAEASVPMMAVAVGALLATDAHQQKKKIAKAEIEAQKAIDAEAEQGGLAGALGAAADLGQMRAMGDVGGGAPKRKRMSARERERKLAAARKEKMAELGVFDSLRD